MFNLLEYILYDPAKFLAEVTALAVVLIIVFKLRPKHVKKLIEKFKY